MKQTTPNTTPAYMDDSPNRLRRNKLLLSVSVATSLLLGACSNGNSSNEDSAPQPSPTTVERVPGIEDYIDSQSLAGPTAMTWSECPPGGSELPEDVIVNGFNHGDNYLDQDGYRSGTTEIRDVTEYVIGGEVVGWCGESIGEFPEYGVEHGPVEGTITFIPAMPGCQNDAMLVPAGCSGRPVVGKERGHEPANGTFDLGPIVPEEIPVDGAVAA